MKDFINNELNIGDRVAYARNPYSDLYVGVIVEFTNQKIRIGKTIKDVESSILTFPYQTVKVWQQEK